MLKDNLKTLRKNKGLSQEELSIKLNVVRQTVSKWEQGLSVPDAEMLIAISEVFDTPVSTILGENIDENEKNVKNENKKYSGKTALVGDNLSASYSNTKAILENLGFTVDIAESSNYLVNKIKYGEKYDIIFSNNIYRDGTGPECLKKLKNVKGFSTPVIVHTITKDARNHFVNDIGFDDYIEKPVTEESTLPVLEKFFG